MNVSMRPFLIWTILICTITLTTGYGQVKLIGKIENYDGKSIVSYYPTLDGISSSYLYAKQVKPTRKGDFEIEFANEGIGTLRLSFQGLTYSFVHQRTSKLFLVIDQSKISFPRLEDSDRYRADHLRDSIKQLATISIDGDLDQINRHYNKTLRSATSVFRVQGCDYSILLSKARTPKEAMVKMDSMIQHEINAREWMKPAANGERTNAQVNTAVDGYVTTQIKLFYWNVFLGGMMLKRIQQMQARAHNPAAEPSIYNQQWESLIHSFLKDLKGNIHVEPTSFESTEFILALDYAVSQYQNYDVQLTIPANDELVLDKFSDAHGQELDSLIGLDDKAILAYRLHNLSRFLQTPTFYSPTLLSSIERLQQQYGKSPHLLEFSDEIEKLRVFLKTTNSTFSKAVFIKTNYLTFEDLLLQLKGEKYPHPYLGHLVSSVLQRF